MPIGPIALLCISNTLEKGRAAGLATGLGAATADGIYGILGSLGFAVIATSLSLYAVWIKAIGGCFLLYLGHHILKEKISKKRADISSKTLLKTYCLVILLTLMNPTTILTFMGAFAGMGVGNTNGDLVLSLYLGVGVLLGSILWHSLLVSGATLLRERIKTKHLIWVNKASGVLIGGFGCLSLGSLFWG